MLPFLLRSGSVPPRTSVLFTVVFSAVARRSSIRDLVPMRFRRRNGSDADARIQATFVTLQHTSIHRRFRDGTNGIISNTRVDTESWF